MFLIKRKVKKDIGTGKILYQYKDGSYLPDSSQPIPGIQGRYTPHESTRYINVTMGENGHPMLQKCTEGEYKLIECDKELPELYKQRDHCCGCTACYAICPMSGPGREKSFLMGKEEEPRYMEFLITADHWLIEKREFTGAITMFPDEEGFLYPVIDASICIRCYKCVSVCEFKIQQKQKICELLEE